MKRTRAWSIYVGWGLAGFASSVAPAQSALAKSGIESLIACTRVEDDKSRLECYDEQMGRARRVRPAPESKTAPPPAPVASAEVSKGDFGLQGDALRKKREAESRPAPEEPVELSARVKSISERAHGEYRIELDNGQVWVETLRTGGLAPEVGEDVVIRRGLMGSFYLTRKTGSALRVKRLK